MIPTDDVPQKKSPKAPDGGWSWVIAICAFFSQFIFIGLPLTFGILFHEKLTQMEVSSTTVTWIFNLFNFNFYVLRICSGALSDVFSWRSVGFVMSSMTALGYICMVFVNGPGLLCFLFSIVTGCSAGIAAGIGFLVIPHYFNIHRGRAGAIVTTGVSVGQMVLPLLLRLLLDEYGFYGACLLYGGIILNIAALNLLMYPTHQRPMLKGDAMYEETRKALETPTGLNKIKNPPESEHQVKKLDFSLSPTRFEQFKQVFTLTWNHVCQVKRLPLLIANLSFTLSMIGYVNYVTFFPFAMAAIGHPPFEASYCMSAGAASSTVFRIFIILASDAEWFSRKLSFIIGSLISCVSFLSAVFVLHNTWWVMACFVTSGFGIGASYSVFHNLLIDTCGRDLYAAGIAISGLLIGFCSIVLGPIMGLVADYTSYKVSLSMAAILQLISAVLWLFMPLAKKYDEKKFGGEKPPETASETTPSQPQKVEAMASESIECGQINEGFTSDSSVCPQIKQTKLTSSGPAVLPLQSAPTVFFLFSLHQLFSPSAVCTNCFLPLQSAPAVFSLFSLHQLFPPSAVCTSCFLPLQSAPAVFDPRRNLCAPTVSDQEEWMRRHLKELHVHV
ncbi:Major facilitator superfamily [Trinorchestia longiramus]|nr:Major facilitator superfamily [Trinorchestia longiramus]